MEKRLRKNGEVALYASDVEAIEVARKMFGILPKAYEVSVFQSGIGKPIKSFTR